MLARDICKSLRICMPFKRLLFSCLRHFYFSAPSLTLFGASVFVYFLFITDWKVTNAKIPIYGRKFEEMKQAALVEKHGQKAVDEGTAIDD
jgi:hypothetical protein